MPMKNHPALKQAVHSPPSEMDETIDIAITLRVRESHVAEFERALENFAHRSLAEPGARGVRSLYPPPGSASTEYGIIRSFASAADLDAFYRTALFQNWLARIEPMVEGERVRRQVHWLEAWFHDHEQSMPPRWKMALLTWIAVWAASLVMQAVLSTGLGQNVPEFLEAALVAAGVVVILTWVAMPFLVKMAHPWLHPKTKARNARKSAAQPS
jgi:uncharacterized protein